MGVLKSLTGQTAYYGISSMAGRLLNYLLTPMWSNWILPPERLGIVNYLYAWAALLNVVLTYGMETAFFRYSSDPSCDRKKVADTAFTSLFFSTTILLIGGLAFYRQIADFVDYGDQAACLFYFVLIVAMDTYAVIPFAKLRLDNQAFKYAMVRVAGIGLMVLLNLILLYFLPRYGVMEVDVKSIFISNVAGSAFVLLLLSGELKKFALYLNKALWKKMLKYGWPILIGGTAYVVNETMDRVFLRMLLPADVSEYWLGVYGVCFKLAIFITLFVQAFRLAMEPFFFSHARDRDARQTYATVTLYFTVTVSAMYVGIMANLPWLKDMFIGSEYQAGIDIVPIVLFANVFLGLYYNLSMWYKLTDRTKWGAYISILGAIVTTTVIFYGVPRFGYMAAAWSHLATYGVMLLVSFAFGQYFYPVPYNIPKIVLYLLLGWGCGYVSWYLLDGNVLVGNALFAVFCAVVYFVERKNFKKVFS